MKTTDEMIQILNGTESLDGHWGDFREYIISQFEMYKQNPDQGEQIAYEVAGLMGTQVAMSLPADDPFCVALELAGELELPAQHRSETSTWDRFGQLASQLPSRP